MTAIHALIAALLATALLVPVAAADDPQVCIRDGQIAYGAACSTSAGTESEPEDPVEVCVKDGQVVVGPECK